MPIFVEDKSNSLVRLSLGGRESLRMVLRNMRGYAIRVNKLLVSHLNKCYRFLCLNVVPITGVSQ